jgi:hypothetical protein
MDDYQKEMERNYPASKEFVYGKMRQEFERALEPIPEGDFRDFIRKEDGIPLADFIHEIEGPNV